MTEKHSAIVGIFVGGSALLMCMVVMMIPHITLGTSISLLFLGGVGFAILSHATGWLLRILEREGKERLNK